MSDAIILAIAIVAPIAWAIWVTVALVRLSCRHRHCKRTLNRVVGERDAARWQLRGVGIEP